MSGLFLTLALALAPPQPTVAAPTAERELSRVALGLGYTRLTGKINRFDFDRSALVLGLAFDISPDLRMALRLSFGPNACGFSEKVTSTIDLRGQTHIDTSYSVGGDFRWTMRRVRRFALAVYGEFDASTDRSKFTIDRAALSLNNMETDLTSELRRRAGLYFSWTKIAGGLRWSYDFTGGLSPFVTFGFGQFNASLDIELDDETKKFLGAIGYDAGAGEKTIILKENAPLGSLGLEWNPRWLDRRLALTAEGLAFPLKGSWLITATAGLNFRF